MTEAIEKGRLKRIKKEAADNLQSRKVDDSYAIEIINYFISRKKSSDFESSAFQNLEKYVYQLETIPTLPADQYDEKIKEFNDIIKNYENAGLYIESFILRVQNLESEIIKDEHVSEIRNLVSFLGEQEYKKIQASIRQTRKRLADKKSNNRKRTLNISSEVFNLLSYKKYHKINSLTWDEYLLFTSKCADMFMKYGEENEINSDNLLNEIKKKLSLEHYSFN